MLNSSFRSRDSGSANLQQYSSMPMVYFSSQDKLNKHLNRGSSSDNDSWPSFDRLTPHLQSHEIEILASKARSSRPPHKQYKPHFYTPTRVRRDNKDVSRSASFEHGSLSMFRTSSDGTRQSYSKPIVRNSQEMKGQQDKKRYHLTPEKMISIDQAVISSFSTDDMPPLPPTVTIGDVSMDSPVLNRTEPSPERLATVNQINSVTQPIKTEDNVAKPPSDPSMNTPVKSIHSLPPETPQTDTSFDYSDLGSPPHTPYSMTSENDFIFSSPPPAPISSPPKDAVQPLLTTNQVTEGWGPDNNDTSIDRNITPRRALDEAFKALDRVGESTLSNSGDEPSPITKKKEQIISISEDELSSLYASVDMTKKGVKAPKEESDEDEGPPIIPYKEPFIMAEGVLITEQQNTVPGYEELEFDNKKTPPSTKKDDGYEEVEFDSKKASKPRNKLSIDDNTGYAQIVSTSSESGHARILNDDNTGYAQIVSTSSESGHARILNDDNTGYEAVGTKRPLSEDLSKSVSENVHKASSEDNVLYAERAEVHLPYRASMPPGVLVEDKFPLRTKGGSPPRKAE